VLQSQANYVPTRPGRAEIGPKKGFLSNFGNETLHTASGNQIYLLLSSPYTKPLIIYCIFGWEFFHVLPLSVNYRDKQNLRFMKLKIATSQFSVSSKIEDNKKRILAQVDEAKNLGVDLIHFPEGSLSGYAGVDFEAFVGFNWDELKTATNEIIKKAKEAGIWIVLGSAHRLENHKPHNSLYIIDNTGNIVDRYDKMFCAGTKQEDTEDLLHFSPGDHFSIFSVNGIKCGVLICHEYRYPELYREYKKKDVEIIFHSYHAGNMKPTRQTNMENEVGEAFFAINTGRTIPEITMPSTMVSYAANNYMWISCSNTSARESCWASMIVRPDGVVVGRLDKNLDGIIITEIDTKKQYYDSTRYWRNRAMEGIFHSGNLVDDNRSKNRTEL
jgi:predicted amidohydrolase